MAEVLAKQRFCGLMRQRRGFGFGFGFYIPSWCRRGLACGSWV